VTAAPHRSLVVDANVLIDYALSDKAVLGLMSRHLGAVYIPRPILAEVKQLTEADCGALGLRIVDGRLEQLLEAGQARGRLSFSDRLCLILARAEKWNCVTNDKALRRACRQVSVRVMWGLEPMLDLVAKGALPKASALAIARVIQALNPLHITAEIVQRFEERLDLGA
jgi:rRNA-processing protein FCF1